MKRSQNKKPPSAIDLFSGCGGLTLGLKQAGFAVLGAVEIDAAASTTYAINHPNVVLKRMDIRKVSPNKFMKDLGLRQGDLDLLAGCPPCQGFSTLRTRNGAKRNRDARNDLIGEVLRFARALKPKTIMMENVPKLADYGPFKELCVTLESMGYSVCFQIKNAALYGVPQRRRRLIMLASRGKQIRFAEVAKKRRTVRQAISALAPPHKSNDALHAMAKDRRSERVEKLIRDIPKNGGSRTDLPNNRQLECHKKISGYKDVYGRMAWDDVAPTITSGCFNPSKGRFLHPDQDRAITMREAALLQTFPRNYFFDPSLGKTAIALMIGNALPPEFIRRHAVEIRVALSN